MSVLRTAFLGLSVLLGGASTQALSSPFRTLNDDAAQLNQEPQKVELAQTNIDLPITIPGLPDQITIPDLPVDLPNITLPTLGELPGLIDDARGLIPDWLEELFTNQTLANSTIDFRLPSGVFPNITWPGYPSAPNATYDNETDTLAITVGSYAVTLSNLNLTGPPELHVDVDAIQSNVTSEEAGNTVQLYAPTLLINDQEYNVSLPLLNLTELVNFWNTLSDFPGLSIPALGIDIPAFDIPKIGEVSGIPSELGYSGLVNLTLPGWTGGLPHVELFGFENWTSSFERNENGSVSILLPPFAITIPTEVVDAVEVRDENEVPEQPQPEPEPQPDLQDHHHTDCEENDIVALNYLLFLKRLQVAYYGDALQYLKAEDFVEAGATNLTFQRLQEIHSQDQLHAEALQSLIEENEGQLWQECNYTFNFGESYNENGTNTQATVDFVLAAQFLENLATSAYAGVAGVFTRDEMSHDVASISLVDARHSAWINPLIGGSPFPDVFEPAVNASSVYQLVESYVTDCPAVEEPVSREVCEAAQYNGTWSNWHACTVSCGGGETYRDCLVDEAIADNSNCFGDATGPCNTQACPVESSTGIQEASSTGPEDRPFSSTGVNTPVISSTAADEVI